MAQIGVAEAARRLAVSVARVHQRIADGSLPAVRVGAQWVIDEAALMPVSELRAPGRPLSRRSAWALVAMAERTEAVLGQLAGSERSRARQRLGDLLAVSASDAVSSEADVQRVAAWLRSVLRSRAVRRLYHAAPRDLPDLRDDDRLVLSGLSDERSGIAAGDVVEGYVSFNVLPAVVDDHLLSPDRKDSNVVLHVVAPDCWYAVDGVGPLLLAADLAEHRGPREEARAVELLRRIAPEAPS